MNPGHGCAGEVPLIAYAMRSPIWGEVLIVMTRALTRERKRKRSCPVYLIQAFRTDRGGREADWRHPYATTDPAMARVRWAEATGAESGETLPDSVFEEAV